jgi:hypothetical protein
VRCHGTKCPLLTAFFLLLSACVTFLPEEVIVGFRNFAWGFKSQKKIVGKQKLGDQFLGFFVKDEKCLELPEMSRKLIGQFLNFFALFVYLPALLIDFLLLVLTPV